MSPPKPKSLSLSHSPLRDTDDTSSSSTPFAALGDINYISSSLSDIPEWNVRDTPPRGNQDVQAWVNSNAALECRFSDSASDLTAISTSPLGEIAIDENDIVVAVMGPTGAGKSTFVDCAVGRPTVNAGHDLMSYTKEMRPVRYPHSDGIRNIVLVDTPGFDDTFMTDGQILRQIAHWLNATYKKNIKLSGVLYLHRISDNRVSRTPLRNYNMFRELCGKENFKNIVLVTTMWDEVTEEVGSARENELQSDFWRSMINLGSTIHRFDGTVESAWKIISCLSVAPPVHRRPLQIQREMVDNHVPLHMTTAGRAVMATLTDLMSGVKGIFKRLKNSTKRSRRPVPQDSKRLLQRLPSLLSTSSFTTSSDTSSNSRSTESGIISLRSSGTCSIEGYRCNLVRVFPVLQAALGVAELVRIPHLKDVISPSLSIALSIKTMTGAHHVLFQVLATATLLINAVAEHTRQTRLPAKIKTAIKDFAKQMSDVQGIVQNVARRESEVRQVLRSTDARVISACANSMRLVCDVLRLTPSLRMGIRTVDDSLGALKRSLEIDICSCGIPRELVQLVSSVQNAYIIFVVDPAEAGQSLFANQLLDCHGIKVAEMGPHRSEHVKALRCNLVNGPVNIVVVKIPLFHSNREDLDLHTENAMISWLSLSEKCHSGILFLHSLESDPTDGHTLMIQRFESLIKRFSSQATVPSCVYVVPTINLGSLLPDETLSQQLSQLKNTIGALNCNRNNKWHASIFPEVYKGQPETAWSAALLLLKDIAEIQAKVTTPLPKEPALKRMPLQLPDGHLALKDLADLLFSNFKRRERVGNCGVITLGRTVLELTPPDHLQRHSALISLAALLFERFQREGTKEDLDETITLKRAASEYISSDDPQRQTILLELDDCLYERFRRSDSIADLEEIISLRRVLLEHTPTPDRCRPLLNLANSLHGKFQKQGSISDINEAINLADAALGLCRPGHADHALSQNHLASYLETKVSKGAARAHATVVPSNSGSSDIKQFIKKVVFETLESIPPRLLHARSGILCNRDAQLSHFERSPQYRQLLLSTSPPGSQQLRTEISDAVLEFFAFSTLSHRWGSGEPLLREIEGKNIYDLGGKDGREKLQRFCILALRRGFQWAWSDTCCIDKDSSAELQEAIGSMFSWYRRSSLTIVYLSDVFDAGSLANSVWFRRGWTLQELLASHAILFYTYDWSLYTKSDTANHKTDPTVLEELQKATGVAEQHLTNFYPGVDDARTRLHWASGRSTTRPEDIAYSLFGIFKVHLPVLYGESVENALGRLLAEIISRSGDISVLDWVGEASSFNSCFPANLLPYQTAPDIQVIPSNLAKRNDLGPGKGKGKELYDKLSGLPRAGFANRKLALPSTVHQVTAVKLQSSSTSPSRYTYEIHASRLRPVNVTLSVKLCNRGAYLLVCPWHPKSLETQTESDDDAVWNLLGQLGQPFKALLLKRLPHNEYKRIASDCEINACVRDLASTLDTEVLIPDIV